MSAPAPVTGGRRHTMKVKTLKRKLRAAGVKTTGRKATLLKRAKKAHIKLGGALSPMPLGGRRRSRRRGGDAMTAPVVTGETPAPTPEATQGGRRRRSRKFLGVF